MLGALVDIPLDQIIIILIVQFKYFYLDEVFLLIVGMAHSQW